ncbi:hypothetical protein NMY22_g8934 [Coprinellus aureogranulatus]|nr:hypothetical protein NMY22_g8934 [Coprinellus aureogranulatus]
MVTATTSYGHLPAELHDKILSYCSRASLVSLCLTSKSTSQEAEAMLYDTITLHRSREHEFACCLRTMNDLGTSRKAELVQTFAVTLTEDHGDFNDLQLAVTALSGMKSLKVLSIWTPEEISTVSVQLLMRSPSRPFSLRKLCLSGFRVAEFSFVLQNQPSIEVVGLWSDADRETEAESEAMAELQRSLAGHLLNALNEPEKMADSEQTTDLTSESPSKPKPIIFGVERRAHYFGDVTLRTLTIYDHPLAVSRGSRPTTDFLEFAAKNLEAYTQIHRDLSLDFSQDDQLHITNQLQLVVCDISSNSLGWARRVALPVLQMYPEAPPIGGALVSLSVIEPPKRPLNMAMVRNSFKAFVATLLERNVDEFFMQSYFVDEENWDSHRWAATENSSIMSREESVETGKALAPLVVEVASSSKGSSRRFLDLRIFHEEYLIPLDLSQLEV